MINKPHRSVLSCLCPTEEQHLVKELVAMSTRNRIKAIRDLPMSFDDKKHIRYSCHVTVIGQKVPVFLHFYYGTFNL